MARIDKNEIEHLINITDIKKLIEMDGINFQRKGQNDWACCPFHDENTPSFTINKKHNTYKCYGCNVSGNAINWLREYKRITFIEAVKKLANINNIKLQLDANPLSEQENNFFKLTGYVNFFFQLNLKKNNSAISYLREKRELSDDIIKLYQIGYVGSGLVKLLEKKHSQKELLDSGICYLNHNTKQLSDLLKYRITIPIKNLSGKIVGFSGRNLIDKNDYPKYINTPETNFCKKRELLFGLDLVFKNIKLSKKVVIVEGFLDQISLYQHGEKEAVSSMGTALTENQLKLLIPHVETVYFAFDGDSAGRIASKSALKLFLKLMTNKITANFVFLDDIDPDDFIKKYKLNGWNDKLKNSIKLSDYLVSVIEIDSGIKITSNLSVEQKVAIFNIAQEYIDIVKNADLFKDVFISHLKQKLDSL